MCTFNIAVTSHIPTYIYVHACIHASHCTCLSLRLRAPSHRAEVAVFSVRLLIFPNTSLPHCSHSLCAL